MKHSSKTNWAMLMAVAMLASVALSSCGRAARVSKIAEKINMGALATRQISRMASSESSRRSLEDAVVGSWQYSQSETQEDTRIAITGVDAYSSNGSVSSYGNVAMTFFEQGGSFTLEYRLEGQGTWSVNESQRVMNSRYNTFHMTFVSAHSTFQDDYNVREHIQELRQLIASNVIPSMRSEVMQSNSSQILSCNAQQLVMTDDGTTTTYNRVN